MQSSLADLVRVQPGLLCSTDMMVYGSTRVMCCLEPVYQVQVAVRGLFLITWLLGLKILMRPSRMHGEGWRFVC